MLQVLPSQKRKKQRPGLSGKGSFPRPARSLAGGVCNCQGPLIWRANVHSEGYAYPLVNIQKNMEHHHFSWINQHINGHEHNSSVRFPEGTWPIQYPERHWGSVLPWVFFDRWSWGIEGWWTDEPLTIQKLVGGLKHFFFSIYWE
jgi:hypothetical protein